MKNIDLDLIKFKLGCFTLVAIVYSLLAMAWGLLALYSYKTDPEPAFDIPVLIIAATNMMLSSCMAWTALIVYNLLRFSLYLADRKQVKEEVTK